MSKSSFFEIRSLVYSASSSRCKESLLRTLIIALFVFVQTTIVHADGLFDFQMKLAKKGNAEAEFKVGEMYETGFGVKKDMKLAEEWINKAAAQNHEVAGFKLLYWDIKKNGITKDNKAQYEALTSKAKSGNGHAQYYVGKLYAGGFGVKRSPTKALELFNKAALLGVLEAEREATTIREEAQRAQLAKRRAEQKRQAALKAKREEEKLKKLEAKRKAEAAKKLAAQKEAERKRREAEAKNAEAAARDAERIAAEKERRALEQERERRRAALLSKRKEREAKRKEEFESDPCSGKSARFLSTCR